MDKLGRSLTAKQFIEWEAYARLEPFNELRADYRAASIAAMIANVNRGKGEKPFTLEDVMVKFEEAVEETPKVERMQTWQQQKTIAELMVKAFNGPGRDL